MNNNNGQYRDDIHIGDIVDIVLKQNQRTRELTRGVVARILTNSLQHSHGIKVMLEGGEAGRVKEVF